MVADDIHLDTIEFYMGRRWRQAQRLTTYVRDLWADYRQLDVDDRDHVVRQLEHLQGRWNRGGFRNGHEL